MIGWLRPTTELKKSMAMVLRNLGKEIHGHCRWCPTDYVYSVILSKIHGQLIFSGHDFGAYGPVLNLHWRSQVCRQDHYYRQPHAEFDRVPGGCRDACFNGPLGEDWST